jgi:glycosyltransferase involved in cell wall biosynthesis
MSIVAAVDARSALGSEALPRIRVVPSISVVVPVLNEALSVEQLFDELRAVLQELEQPWEVIFVDDGSTDSTYAELKHLHEEHAELRVVRLRRKFGKSAALAAGFDVASGDLIVTIDGDLQDDPTAIPGLLSKLAEGWDLVSGWKRTRQDTWSRRVASRFFNAIVGFISGVRLHDMNCGLKVYRADVVRGLALYGELHRFVPVLAHQRGFRVAEMAVSHRPRVHGRSRYGLERYLRGLLDLITVCFLGRYRYRPLHLFGSLGLALSTAAFGILSYLTALKVAGHPIGQRPLLLLGVLLAVTGFQFLSIGLIGELITTQHEERRAPADRLALRVDEIL